MSFRTTAIDTPDSATTGLFAATNDGPGGAGKCGLILDDHPNISAGIEIVTTEKTTGLSEVRTGSAAIGQELTLTKKQPMLSLGSFGLTPEKAEIFLWSLLQKGASESGTTSYTKVYVPYVQGQPDPEMWIDVSRSIGDPASVTGYGHVLTGAICTSFGVSGSQGERLIAKAELTGRSFRTNYVHAASVFTPEDTADHVFLDYAWTLGGTTARLQSFDFTITNGATPLFYNSLVPTGFTLHRLSVTGTFSLAMSTTTLGDNAQIDNWVSGADLLLTGTHSGSAIIFSFNTHYTGAEVDAAETEHLLNLPFEGASDGTNHVLNITVVSANELSIPA
jgi:hypothetical protein